MRTAQTTEEGKDQPKWLVQILASQNEMMKQQQKILEQKRTDKAENSEQQQQMVRAVQN